MHQQFSPLLSRLCRQLLIPAGSQLLNLLPHLRVNLHPHQLLFQAVSPVQCHRASPQAYQHLNLRPPRHGSQQHSQPVSRPVSLRVCLLRSRPTNPLHSLALRLPLFLALNLLQALLHSQALFHHPHLLFLPVPIHPVFQQLICLLWGTYCSPHLHGKSVVWGSLSLGIALDL